MTGRWTTRPNGGLHPEWLASVLDGAVSYDRIAGYFRSSVLAFAQEPYERVRGKVRVVCNADLDPGDIATAKSVAAAARRGWNAEPHDLTEPEARTRYTRLAELLASGRFEVYVLPRTVFGLVHGKAGVVRYADGRARAFLGSGNETREGYTSNYEMLWEDDDPAAAAWVQAEFDALLQNTQIKKLNEALSELVEKALDTVKVPISKWNPDEAPAAAFAESPIERIGTGLMPHQKDFVGQVIRDAATFGGAQFLLADEVGLGKTVQLGMAAALLALREKRPSLILAPKNVVPGFQRDLWQLLGVPSAAWDGMEWTTEDERVWTLPIGSCPRQIALVPTSRVFAQTPDVQKLLDRDWACVVLDEAHRARTNQVDDSDGTANNLRTFMEKLAPRARSLLLGTATPVQLHRQELWDLLKLLDLSAARKAGGHGRVLGSVDSRWQKSDAALNVVAGGAIAVDTPVTAFQWLCDPLPPRWEAAREHTHTLSQIWESLPDPKPDTKWEKAALAADFDPGLKDDLVQYAPELVRHHNPFVRHVIKRTRDGLAANPVMQGYGNLLKRIEVDASDASIPMSEPLAAAYEAARVFCVELARRNKSAGILKTLVLRRISSSLYAGRRTALKFLEGTVDSEGEATEIRADARTLTPKEREALDAVLQHLEECGGADPKLMAVIDVLEGRTAGSAHAWLNRGCILFSMYFDTAAWMADALAQQFPAEPVGVYGGGAGAYVLEGGERTPISRDDLVKRVAARKLRLLVATDAASEGLNLQRLGTVVNIDLPWNPARLEQRVGRVKRIGQEVDRVKVLNLWYEGSVEDQVHQKLSVRLEDVNRLFGTLPDHLEDVWVVAALEGIEKAQQRLYATPLVHPFKLIHDERVDTTEWDRAAQAVPLEQIQAALAKAW